MTLIKSFIVIVCRPSSSIGMLRKVWTSSLIASDDYYKWEFFHEKYPFNLCYLYFTKMKVRENSIFLFDCEDYLTIVVV